MTLSQMIAVSWLQFAVAAALVLGLAQWILRRFAQPADRIRLILLAIVTVMAIPICAALGPWPTWRLNWITPVDISQASPSERTTPPNSPMAPAGEQKDFLKAELLTQDGQGWSAPSGTWSPELSPSMPAPIAGDSKPIAPPRSHLSLWDVAAIAIVAVHGFAVVHLLLEWAIGFVMLRRLRFAASPSTVDLDRQWNHVTQGHGKNVQRFVSHSIDTPLTFGWFRPIVLLPADLAEKGGSSLTYCLAHEWSHVERGDIVAWNFLRASQVLLWFIPFYWALRTELRLSQDMLADDRASGARADAVEYSELLVSFARKRMNVPAAAALTFLHHPSQLTKRIKMLLLKTVSVRAHCSWRFSLATGIAAIVLAACFSSVRLDATRADDKADTAKASEPAKEEKKGATALPTGPLKYTCRIVDKETGKGIPNARVVVRRSNSQDRRIIEESKHTTDAEGNYIVDIPEAQVADRYMYIELDVEHDDYSPRKGFGYSLGMIMKNEKLGERPFFERTELYAGEPLTGTIVLPDGTPAAGVKVQSFSMASQNDFNSMSFSDTLTDSEGRFRLMLHKGSDGILWVIPKDFAVTEKFLAKQRGDLGTITLTKGVRIGGRVLGADGKPLAGLAVNIDYTGDRDTGGVPVGTSVGRGVISDAEGRFTFDPLPPGDYSIAPGEYLSDPLVRDRTRYELPAVFVAKKIAIKDEPDPAPVEIQAIPHIVFNAQIVDGAGKKTTGHEFFLFGQLDGTTWFGQGRPNKEGTVAMKVPHGLQQAQVNLMTNEHGALRYRRGKDQPLQNEVRYINFGTLNDDVEGFEIVRYKAPLVLVSAVDEAKQPIKDFRVAATYPWGKQEYVIEGETRSDMSFEKQNDGRYRTSQMLPDEEVTFTVTAKGYQPVSEKINLPEGETKELVVMLKKSDGEAPAAEEKKATAPQPTPPQSTKVKDSADSTLLAEFKKLKEAMDKLNQDANSKVIAAKVDDRGAALTEALQALNDQGNPMAETALSLAKAHDKDPLAVEILIWILANQSNSPSAPEAASLLVRNHPADARTLEIMSGYTLLPMPWTEKSLRDIASFELPREQKGLALFHLAQCLKTKAEFPDVFKSWDDGVLKLMDLKLGREYAKELAAGNAKRIQTEALQVLHQVVDNYGDVKFRAKTLGQRSKSAIYEIENLSVGCQAPELEGEDLDEKPLKLSDFRGKVVVVTFWATWCGPCMGIIPDEVALAKKMSDQPFVFLGVNGDQDRAAAKAAVEKEGIPWQSIWNGGAIGSFTEAWNIEAWPTIYVIDHQGIIRGKQNGPPPHKLLEELVEAAQKANS